LPASIAIVARSACVLGGVASTTASRSSSALPRSG